MSLALRPPRTSALGVSWSESFRRGRLGVRKNQGTINGVVPIVGAAARFDGNTANYISYPHLTTRGVTGITVGARVKDAAALLQCVVGQIRSTAWPANVEFQLYINANGTWGFTIHNGAGSQARGTTGVLTGDDLIIGTWTSGGPISMYQNGELDPNSGGVYAGSLNDAVQELTVGRRAIAELPADCDIEDPFVEFRCWSATEIRNYFRRSSFV